MLMPTKKLENGKALLSVIALGSFSNYTIVTKDYAVTTTSLQRSESLEIGNGQ